MSSAARRIADLEVIARSRQPDGPPTWTFFAQQRFQAAANYGNEPPAVVLESIEAVERVIAAVDAYRRDHHLDVVDTAITISHHAFPDHAQTASGIAGMLVEAFWYWDAERFGEAKAWRHQRSRSEFEGQVGGRLGGG
jgi:hypothetical protein